MIALIDHIKLLVVLGNLLAGAAMAAYLNEACRRYALAPLRSIFFNTVFYNLLVLTLFVGKYYQLNIGAAAFSLTEESKRTLLLLLAYSFVMGFSYSSLGAYLAFMQKKLSPKIGRSAATASLLLLAGIPLGHFLPREGILRIAHYHFYENAGVIFLALELCIMIALPVQARRLMDRESSRVARAFSFLYISRYPVIAALILLPQPFRLFFALLYPNIVPYIWLRFFALPAAERAVTRETFEAHLGIVAGRYGLSPREREILALILAGKSNRDMEETLFISYHTVKNHVYNIYRKLGVKTRFELLHLVSGSNGGGTS